MTTAPQIKAGPIQQRLMEFIRREFPSGSHSCNVAKLVGDASARQYFRLVLDSGRSFILAVYPEPFDPDHFSYRQIAQLLEEIGVPIPRILSMDGGLGIVLQEDLGNLSLQRHLVRSERKERLRRFSEAVDLVVAIQRLGGPRLRPEWEAFQLAFDEEKLMWEFRFFLRQYLGNYRGRPAERAELEAEFGAIARRLAAEPRVLCHRDFHVRNLMLKDDRLHVIDFQDARWGPPSYDLASLLKDSIDLPADELELLARMYLERAGLPQSEDEFQVQFHLMTVQRMLKALGTYGYQVVVRENFIYEQYMTGSLQRALRSLDFLDQFPATRTLVADELRARENSESNP